MKKAPLLATVAGALVFAVNPAVWAGDDHGYLVCTNGKPVKNSWGECVMSVTRQSEFEDCGDMMAKAPEPAPAPKPTVMHETMSLSAKALFDFDKTVIKPEGAQTLTEVANKLKSMMLNWVRLTGHTDSMGSDSYNQELSEKRANAVKSYLVGEGVDGGKISTRGEGESSPVASNDTREGRAKNRRVDVEIEAVMTK